ncbi:MAG: hypothetical protein HYZ16_08780 [Bacteroidetes bacterium]|jgi:hypothetical protein|nr:hypothetical protein [Bacteroidota bacterium]
MLLFFRKFILVIFVLSIVRSAYGLHPTAIGANKVQDAPLGVVLSYYGPAIHPGLRVAYRLPFIEKTWSMGKGSTPLSNLFKVRHQMVIEPYMALYNHRFNHMGVAIGVLAMQEMVFFNRFSFGLGGHLARLTYLYRDVMLYTNRSFTSKKVMGQGYNQLGAHAQLGIRFHKGGIGGLFYRPYLGLLFPFNHLFSAYLHHEMGIVLTINK